MLCYLEKPPSSAIGVVNEVCSWALVWQFDETAEWGDPLPFPPKKGRGSAMVVRRLIFLPVRNGHVEETSFYLAAVLHF